MFDSITNRGEFFSNHYLDSVIGGDLSGLRAAWDLAEGKDEPSARSLIKALRSKFFDARAVAVEASETARSEAIKDLNSVVLKGLGFSPAAAGSIREFKRNTVDLVHIPVAAEVETSTGLLLLAVHAELVASVDDLFDDDQDEGRLGFVLDPCYREAEKKHISSISGVIAEAFSVDEPPRFVLVLGGRVVLLAERSKWPEGRYLAVNLDLALEKNDTKARGELETIAALFSADALVPGVIGDGDGGQSLFDEIVEKSQKHAVGVSKELRTGIRESIEILANEVIEQRDNKARAANQKLFTRTNVDATELTRQCLRYLYRLLVLLYAESRPELGVLPVRDEAYMEGYSLDRLRELCLVDLETDKSRNGSHFDESLTKLFELVNEGNHVEGAQQQFNLDLDSGDAQRSTEEYLLFPGLDAQLFDPESTALVSEVTLRNVALQQVLKKLMLAEGKTKRDSAGFISYAQLGINQLGAVYEGLMAYTGFYADGDLYEVAKNGDPSDGTWMLSADEVGEYPDEVFVTRPNTHTGVDERVWHPKGSFVFRLAGRDRQRSASYYTPEVLTRCVVKHALAELLGLDDYAPENGSSGITQASQILELTICEPALGSGAFLNEAINQLADEYLKRRQAELGDSLDPETLNKEKQKVKAHFALNQSYGVDLNATAVELAEVSLWLNAMYPGLDAPWFGLQLRSGNSLIGCRRATWTVNQLGDKPWNQTKKDHLQPPKDRTLGQPLESSGSDAEIHYFLLPGHGWASVSSRKEAKELRPDETQTLKNWRNHILGAPKKSDGERLAALAVGVEAMWAAASQRIRLVQASLYRPIEFYGRKQSTTKTPGSRQRAEVELSNPDSALGRLRIVMDAWVGLWFWPLDSGETPPTWGEWLGVLEQIIQPEVLFKSEGQLDFFADLDALNEAEEKQRQGQVSIAALKSQHPWLQVAVNAAQGEAAFHWDLEFAPVFEQRGGFDLQVGNPPWVRPRWYEDLVLAEDDPWWGVTEKPGAKKIKERRASNLTNYETQRGYLEELASSQGVVEILGSPVERPLLAGVQTNLYMAFMDTVWRHASTFGISGLLHPEGHFTDPKAGDLRRATYIRLRRHFMFYNELKLFEDVHNHTEFGIHIYGLLISPHFINASTVLHPVMVDASLRHDGVGAVPAQQFASGGRDLRPHRSRILIITEEVLTDWALLFDEPGTPAAQARLLRPVTTDDLEALAVLADQPMRLADHEYHWTRGHEEDGAKTDGTIRWETATPTSWDEVILQGPHFSVATPFNKQPNEECKNNRDYSEWDLESLPEYVIPRTNYQRACTPDEYKSRLDHWDSKPSMSYWRHIHREMTQAGLERSVQGALIGPGPSHIHACLSYGFKDLMDTVRWAGLLASLPIDYLFKASGAGHIAEHQLNRLPFPKDRELDCAVMLRILRLNCLTRDYAPLWEELLDSVWQQDSWTDLEITRSSLGNIDNRWTMDTPLRRDQDRRQALVELDALAALMLGLSAEQLCAMYRTQFAVLRKYEYKMVFDAEGRKICGYHQSAGFRQSQLQDQAKAGELPPSWKNLWKLYEQYEEDPDSVDWLGHYTTPFRRADREAEMTLAYNTFKTRHGSED